MMRVGLELLINFIFAIGALLLGHHIGHKNGAEEVQGKWDTEKADIVTAQRDKETELQAGMDKLQKEKNRETAKLQRAVAALTHSLRTRPERPTMPEAASTGDGTTGCTGARLYKSDGEFLIWESARADRLRLALIQCQTAYEKARQQ